MASLKLIQSYDFSLSKEEFTLITKALVGKLRDSEIEAAQNLGFALDTRSS